jgi:hypothetical protein
VEALAAPDRIVITRSLKRNEMPHTDLHYSFIGLL